MVNIWRIWVISLIYWYRNIAHLLNIDDISITKYSLPSRCRWYISINVSHCPAQIIGQLTKAIFGIPASPTVHDLLNTTAHSTTLFVLPLRISPGCSSPAPPPPSPLRTWPFEHWSSMVARETLVKSTTTITCRSTLNLTVWTRSVPGDLLWYVLHVEIKTKMRDGEYTFLLRSDPKKPISDLPNWLLTNHSEANCLNPHRDLKLKKITNELWCKSTWGNIFFGNACFYGNARL